MKSNICITCGTCYPPSEQVPKNCPICEDDRQYVHPEGQQWTISEEMEKAGYRNRWREVDPGLEEVVMESDFAIGTGDAVGDGSGQYPVGLHHPPG
ncbi:hypothetical protein GCM10007416_16530 [Kroppenstedtia guangzhouensis]|jgi:hypothetical protein|uniref:Uncharacterized protein n=1 Tax=Kroppenstedtia guangzhouensis TaxID=1274356 RepID=A0ABQ1GHT7_9BACL|nr:hypothetical protein [Kroppenstedtia guangzhouensis]GGA44079.1 hypothetical protein GCM10007416_16530 [Kroppenstedtia guangzhouensis]